MMHDGAVLVMSKYLFLALVQTVIYGQDVSNWTGRCLIQVLGMLKRNRLLGYSELICIKGENGLCLLLTQGINVTDECSERGYQIAK